MDVNEDLQATVDGRHLAPPCVFLGFLKPYLGRKPLNPKPRSSRLGSIQQRPMGFIHKGILGELVRGHVRIVLNKSVLAGTSSSPSA